MHRLLLLLFTSLFLALSSCMSPEDRLAHGDDLYLRGHFAGALQQYQTARRSNPNLPGIDQKIHNTQIRVFMARGDLCVRQYQWVAAEQAYQEVRRLDPGNKEVDDRLSRLQIARANYHFTRGNSLLVKGNPFEAITEFEQALIYQPAHPRAALSLERARLMQKEYESRAEIAYQKGVVQRQARHYEEALRYFAQAWKLNPQHHSAKLEMDSVGATLADLLITDGDEAMAVHRFAEALVLYRRAARWAKNRSDLPSRIVQAEFETRAADLVIEAERALSQQQWRLAYEKFDAARCLTSHPERFAARYERARNGYAAELYYNAKSYEAAGRYEDALAGYASVLDCSPGYRDSARSHRSLTHRLHQAELAYVAGCAAQKSCNILGARDKFHDCVSVLAAYRDAAQRLAEAEGTIAIAQRLYTRGSKAELHRKFSRAILLYEECLALTTPFRDSASRLERLRKRGKVDSVLHEYDQAHRAQTQRDLQNARVLFDKCQKSHPEHEDVRQRLQTVNSGLAKAKKHYDRGRTSEKRCDLEQASKLYGQTLAICTPFADTKTRLQNVNLSRNQMRQARRLDRARKLIAAQKLYTEVLKRHAVPEARQRTRQIDKTKKTLAKRYKSMQAAHRAKKFRLALTIATGIRKTCVGYRDVDRQIPIFESEADFADGKAFVARGRHESALRCFSRCSKRNPKFRNVRELLRISRNILRSAKPRR